MVDNQNQKEIDRLDAQLLAGVESFQEWVGNIPDPRAENAYAFTENKGEDIYKRNAFAIAMAVKQLGKLLEEGSEYRKTRTVELYNNHLKKVELKDRDSLLLPHDKNPDQLKNIREKLDLLWAENVGKLTSGNDQEHAKGHYQTMVQESAPYVEKRNTTQPSPDVNQKPKPTLQQNFNLVANTAAFNEIQNNKNQSMPPNAFALVRMVMNTGAMSGAYEAKIGQNFDEGLKTEIVAAAISMGFPTDDVKLLANMPTGTRLPVVDDAMLNYESRNPLDRKIEANKYSPDALDRVYNSDFAMFADPPNESKVIKAKITAINPEEEKLSSSELLYKVQTSQAYYEAYLDRYNKPAGTPDGIAGPATLEAAVEMGISAQDIATLGFSAQEIETVMNPHSAPEVQITPTEVHNIRPSR